MSRATIEQRTGLDKVAALISRTPNFAFWRCPDPLGMSSYEPIRIEVFTESKGLRYINKRLGQTFHSQQQPGAAGMLRKVNRQLESRSSEAGEARNLGKRLFLSFRRASKALIRRGEGGREGFYLIKSTYRGIKERLERCPVSL